MPVLVYLPLILVLLLSLFSTQGWMNETDSYDPETFHPSITHSVHVSLDGSQLQVAYPRVNIPRWSAFDESSPEAHISHARTYQLANSKVSGSAKHSISALCKPDRREA